MAADWDLEIGDHLTRGARVARFGGGKQGGMEPSAQTPNIFLYSDPSRGAVYGYTFDGWTPDRKIFLYTGEGTIGDQVMTDGNKGLLEHKSARRSVRLFVADGLAHGKTKNHLYVGEFELDSNHPYTVEDAPDRAGELRTVFVFRLIPLGETLHRPVDDSVAGAPAPGGEAELVEAESNIAMTFETPGAPPSTAVKREAELVKRFTESLTAEGHRVRRWKLRAPGELTPMHTDIYDEWNQELFEAKGSANRSSVRLALGQLLDYARHLPKPAQKLTILLPNAPAEDLLELLHQYQVGCVWETPTGTFERRDAIRGT